MQRPDTIIEMHRERVQDQTVEMFGGDKYTEAVDGPGYSATATLDLTLDRVWFVFDARQRLWQEQAEDETHDPLRHFAIDLAIFDSKITIDSVSCIPLVSLPPRTITIPDGPRADESREIPLQRNPVVRSADRPRSARAAGNRTRQADHRPEFHRTGCARAAGQPFPRGVRAAAVRRAHRSPPRRQHRLHRPGPTHHMGTRLRRGVLGSPTASPAS